MTTPMTPTTIAETILRDVPRYGTKSIGTRTFVGQDDQGGMVRLADVLAALTAAMDPAIAERAGEVLEGVTEGPWATGELTKGGSYRYLEAPDWDAFASVVVTCDGERQEEGEANARFIAWCREGVPALLARIAAMEAQIKGLNACIEQLQGPLTVAALTARAEAAETALAAERAKTAKLVEAGKDAIVAMQEARATIVSKREHGLLTNSVHALRAAITEAGQ